MALPLLASLIGQRNQRRQEKSKRLEQGIFCTFSTKSEMMVQWNASWLSSHPSLRKTRRESPWRIFLTTCRKHWVATISKDWPKKNIFPEQHGCFLWYDDWIFGWGRVQWILFTVIFQNIWDYLLVYPCIKLRHYRIDALKLYPLVKEPLGQLMDSESYSSGSQ